MLPCEFRILCNYLRSEAEKLESDWKKQNPSLPTTTSSASSSATTALTAAVASGVDQLHHDEHERKTMLDDHHHVIHEEEEGGEGGVHISTKPPVLPIGRVAVAGVMYLRFLCPAITVPAIYGILPETPSEKARRLLTLMTKTLQNLANGVRFGGKERYMQKLNEFIDADQDRMEEYLRVVSTIPTSMNDTGPSRVLPPANCKEWSLHVLHDALLSHFDAILRSPSLASLSAEQRATLRKNILACLGLPPPLTNQCHKVGVCQKQGGKLKLWKERCLLLKGDYIWYTSDLTGNDATKLKGIIKLTGSSVSASTVDEKEPEYKYGFMIEHPGRRTFLLRVKTQQECNDWVHAIHYEIQQGIQREQTELARAQSAGDPTKSDTTATSAQDSKAAKEKAAIKAKLLAKAQARGIVLPTTSSSSPMTSPTSATGLLSKNAKSDQVAETELESVGMVLPPPPPTPSVAVTSTPALAKGSGSQRKLELPPRSSNTHLQLTPKSSAI